MPTLIETNTLEDCVRLSKGLNLNFIELNMNLPQFQTDRLNMEKLKTIQKNEGVYFTIHLDENLNVCDFNRKVAEAYTSTVLTTIEIAKTIHAPVLNMHMAEGVYFTLPEQKVYLYAQYQKLYLAKLGEFRAQCEKAIGTSGIKICVENTSWHGKEFIKNGIETLLQSDVFALTYDIGHDHSSGGLDGLFIQKHENRLFHMHAHDAVGEKNHLALGTGEINLREKLSLAQKCGCRVVLETKTVEGLKESAAAANRLVKEISVKD